MWLSCVLLKVKQLFVRFFNRSLSETASLQPISAFLSKSASTVKFVNLLHFFSNQVVSFLEFENTAALNPPIRNEFFPKKKSDLWYTHCPIFSKFLMKRKHVHTFHYRSPKLKLDPQSQKRISLRITKKLSLNLQIDNFFHRSKFQSTIPAFLASKRLNYTVNNLYLQKLPTLSIAKFTTSTRTISGVRYHLLSTVDASGG